MPESKSIKNRLHIDLTVGGGRSRSAARGSTRRRPGSRGGGPVHTEAARLARLGARVLGTMDAPGSGHYSVQLAEPEGNEFCVV
ncbi:VOC family protein [Micromonospora sp. NPDC047074]|uniref:VOC family protein n=1 Tax=Micromonospora sp. NPDC047074 TaxID=3154339 RepID=UPI0033D5D54C